MRKFYGHHYQNTFTGWRHVVGIARQAGYRSYNKRRYRRWERHTGKQALRNYDSNGLPRQRELGVVIVGM